MPITTRNTGFPKGLHQECILDAMGNDIKNTIIAALGKRNYGATVQYAREPDTFKENFDIFYSALK